MAFDVSWIYRIIDRYTPILTKINRATTQARKGFQKTKTSMDSLSKSMAGMKGAITSVAGIATIAFPTSKAMAFEDAMIDVQKVVNFKTPDQFKKFREGIFKTSIALGKLPKNIANIAFEGGKLGILPENLQEFMNLVARTSVAFDIVEGVAAETIGSIKTKMGLSVKATGDLMDAVNLLADNTATSGKKVLNVIARTTGTMKTIKMPPQLVAGWAAFADQMEVSPELAASGLNMMVVRMMKMPGMMRKMLKDPNKAIKNFLGKLTKLSEARRAGKIMKLFGDEAGRFVLKAVNSMDLLDKTMAHVSDKTKFAGSMMKELKKKMGAASTSVGKMRAAFEVAMIQIGDGLLPVIKEMTPSIVKFTTGIRAFIQQNPGIIKAGLAIAGIAIALVGISIVIGLVAKAVGILAVVFLAVTSPIGMVVAAIAGIGIAVYMVVRKIYDNWSGIVGFFSGIWDSITNTFSSAVDSITSALAVVWREFSKAMDNPFLAAITTIFAPFLAIPALIFKHWGPISDFFGGIFDKIGSVVGAVGSFFGFGPDEKTGNKTAANSALKGQINGRIEVAATSGTEVKSVKLAPQMEGDVGMNMAGVY